MTNGSVPDAVQVRTRVWAVLRGQFGSVADSLTEDGEFVATLPDGFDSLAALETISRIESEFGLEVDFVAHDVRHWFATPGRIVQFVQDQLEDQLVLRRAR
jgi:acyl carrier protein